ncbi:hypothetical protein EUGRSUZ_J02820 [Eucalyptus grandis]|uniref:Uncharacterized protein n=2 Tax=Eucalyptus grandis TaxID=71139 RepID=A0ACC3JCB0_EUCGR|nr:hypothetical protein EUGRSUZ_J02820 [Eucalyptus grandis]
MQRIKGKDRYVIARLTSTSILTNTYMLESHHPDRRLSKVKVSLPEMKHISILSYTAIHIKVSKNYFCTNEKNNCYKNNVSCQSQHGKRGAPDVSQIRQMPFKGHELQRKSRQLRNETCI